MDKKTYKRQDAIFPAVARKKAALFTGKSKIPVRCPYGGGSYTDGRTVTVGTPEFVMDFDKGYKDAKKRTGMDFNFQEVWMMRMGLLTHECAHLLFSSFGEFKKFQDWAIVEFSSLEPKLSSSGRKALPLVIRKVSAQLNNAMEDGRVENFMVNKYPGAGKYLKFNNLVFWKMQTEAAQSDVVNLTMSLCYYATSGIVPQYFESLDTELKDNVNAVKKDIEEFVNIAGPIVATKKLKNIMLKLKPYLEKILLKEIEDAGKLQEMLDMLSEIIDFQNASPLERPSENLGGEGTISIRGSGKGKKGDEEGEGEGSGSSGSEDGEGEKEDGEGSGSGKDGEEGEDKKGAGDESKDGEGKDYSKDPFASKREAPGHAERSNSEEGEQPSGQNSDNNGAGINTKGHKAPDGTEGSVDEVNEAVKAAIDEAIAEITESSAREIEAQVKKAETEAAADTELNTMDVESIREGYDDPDVEGYASVDVSVNLEAPQEIKTAGRMLRKQLENFFKEQETYDLRDQHSGRLDKKSLRRVATNDFRIFEKKGQPYEIDSCVSIIWDGSGSMCGDKQRRSTIACAIIEEALKPLMPMKITNFTTEGYVVKHFQVKKFDDKDTKRNYAYSYGSSRSFNGGNKDGYSIKIAARELEKRPEQQKILIVLSDGLPSDYRSHSAAINDVKTAVKEARKKGMKVIAIFFGNEDFRRDTRAEYEEMYEKNIISCAPENISKELVKQIRLLFMQK